jgi:hypothetical protein
MSVFEAPSSRVLVDLQVPAGMLGEMMLDTAKAAALPPFRAALPGLRAVHAAVHCFSGHGERIWRDLADVDFLCSHPLWRDGDWVAGLEALGDDLTRAACVAFARFAREQGRAGLPEVAGAGEAVIRARLALLREVARGDRSEIELHLARRVSKPLPALLWEAIRRPASTGAGSPPEAPADPRGLYDLRPGRRALAGARLLLRSLVADSGEREILRLARRQMAAAPPAPFVSPDPCEEIHDPAHA